MRRGAPRAREREAREKQKMRASRMKPMQNTCDRHHSPFVTEQLI